MYITSPLKILQKGRWLQWSLTTCFQILQASRSNSILRKYNLRVRKMCHPPPAITPPVCYVKCKYGDRRPIPKLILYQVRRAVALSEQPSAKPKHPFTMAVQAKRFVPPGLSHGQLRHSTLSPSHQPQGS
jgi:hypothetical protein